MLRRPLLLFFSVQCATPSGLQVGAPHPLRRHPLHHCGLMQQECRRWHPTFFWLGCPWYIAPSMTPGSLHVGPDGKQNVTTPKGCCLRMRSRAIGQRAVVDSEAISPEMLASSKLMGLLEHTAASTDRPGITPVGHKPAIISQPPLSSNRTGCV